MTVGEKIKTFRNIRGFSQKTLGELSGMNEVTIRKYEAGDRNPKPEQLLKIANALGISINIFMDFDVNTVSDVLSLIFKMDEDIDISFEGTKDENGKIDPQTLSMHLSNNVVNESLSIWAYAKALLEKTKNAESEFPTKETYLAEVKDMEEKCEEIKKRLVDNNIIVRKGIENIVVKISNT